MGTQFSETPDGSRRELAEELRDSIRAKTNGSIRGLEVTVNGSSVVISGRTSRYYYKQLATSAVMASLARHELQNEIHVGS
ncbi:hypothetical protein GC176_08765 [bacterium]|nr:hypothetical protein [bacterium]